ncbi:DUF5938 domain-containing protein [Sciscionella marina]|uniref:DUF5938 domain-containing protein n=1 Tax=Sciscionella marina TaxID=508770 RepID=UPI00037C5AC7|nr:DUF5938 domain-containing protein [Sciscionella marina]
MNTDKPVVVSGASGYTGRISPQVRGEMPPRENPRIDTSLDSVHASGPFGRAHCVIHGNCHYQQTAVLNAHAAAHLLQQHPKVHHQERGNQYS